MTTRKIPKFVLPTVLGVLIICLVVEFLDLNQKSPQPNDPSPGNDNTDAPAQAASQFPAKIGKSSEILAWEKAVDEIITSTEDPDKVLTRMVALVKESPGPAQGVIARHLVNLATDENYPEILPLMTDRSLNRRLHVLLAAELMNRKDAIKLPGLLQIASLEWHPFREKALNFLCQLTQQDAGEDWAAWKNIVNKALEQEKG
jgi:hypothetical protein